MSPEEDFLRGKKKGFQKEREKVEEKDDCVSRDKVEEKDDVRILLTMNFFPRLQTIWNQRSGPTTT